MLREITRAAGRYKPGAKHDYPRGVWNKIAADLLRNEGERKVTVEDVERKLNSFSREIDFNPSHQSVTRGPLKIRRRLGTPAQA